MKTIIQHDKTSCGPVAISNALRLFNIKPPSVKKLRKMCKTDRVSLGTHVSQIPKNIKKLGLKCRKKESIKGKGVFLSLIDGTNGGHFVVIKHKYAYNLYKNTYKCKIKKRLKYHFIFLITN